MDKNTDFECGLFHADRIISRLGPETYVYNLCFHTRTTTLEDIFKVVHSDTKILVIPEDSSKDPIRIIREGVRGVSDILRHHSFEVRSASGVVNMDAPLYIFDRIVLCVSIGEYSFISGLIYEDVSKAGTHVLELEDDCTAFIDFGQGVDVSVYLIVHKNITGTLAIIESNRFGFAKDYITEESRREFMNQLRNNFKYEQQ